MSATTRKQATTEESVESQLQRLTQRYKALVERKNEIDQKLETAEAETATFKDQYARSRKQLDELTIEKGVAEKSKNDIDVSYRHLVELRKQNNKHISELQLQVNTLEAKLKDYHSKEERHQAQKARDLHTIEQQRLQLHTQQVFNARKLENEERTLQAKFMNVKQEIKRKFVHDLDSLKQENQIQINDLTSKHKQQMDHLNKHVGDKIHDLQNESRSYRREYDLLSLEIKELSERQLRLEHQVKKEKLISAVNGTDSVDWLSKAGLDNESHRNAIVDMERIVNDLRQRYLETGDQLQVVTKQKAANTTALKKAKADLEDQIRAFQLLEVSKKDMERRLTKRVTELDDQLTRKKQVVANEHATKKAKIQAETDAKVAEVKDLSKQILEAEGELSAIRLSLNSLSQRMNEKLAAERASLFNLETEKREWEVKARLAKASVDTLTEELVVLDKETARLKNQTFNAQNEMTEEQDRNSLLELTIKRLEVRI